VASKANQAFLANKTDIDKLWLIHEDAAGAGPGRKHDVEVLNRAAIVFITACWEAYVEDVATEAFDFLLKEAATSDLVPAKVRTLASKELVEAKDQRRVWELADAGWRTVLQKHRDAVIKKWVSSLDTPKTRQVDELFEELIGLVSAHSHWCWQNMTAEDATTKLDEYITTRGQIAHRVRHDDAVYKSWGTDYLDHVERLVAKTDKAVADHLNKVGKKRPW